jgi:enoyl-CoA hydratase
VNAVQQSSIRVETRDSHLHVVLNRSPVNAFTVDMLEQFTAVLSTFEADSRPLVLTGAGRTFSAGYDMKQAVSGPATLALAHRCVAALQARRSPVIAAVEGAAVGLGLVLAMSADLLVVARDARLGMPEVLLGIVGDVDSLRRYLPELWVRRICLLGGLHSPQDLHLDVAGAVLCDPGGTVDIATSIAEGMAREDLESCMRTKRRLAEPVVHGGSSAAHR